MRFRRQARAVVRRRRRRSAEQSEGRGRVAATVARQAAPVSRHERLVALARDARHATAPPALPAQCDRWLLRLPGTIDYIFSVIILYIMFVIKCIAYKIFYSIKFLFNVANFYTSLQRNLKYYSMSRFVYILMVAPLCLLA